MEESDERAYRRFICPHRGYEGACFIRSGFDNFNGQIVHTLRGCSPEFDCDWMKEFKEEATSKTN